MAYTIKINDVDKTSLVMARSLIINLAADHRDSASFRIQTTAGSYLPRAGQAVAIEDSGTTVFAGVVESAPQSKIGVVDGADTEIFVQVLAEGLHVIPYRRVSALTYSSATDAGDIVSAMITNYLTDDDVTAGTITAGASMPTYDSTGKTIGAVLDELASASGYQWYIDTAKALHFIQDTSISNAAHDILESGGYTDYGNVRVTEQTDQYRNRQVIRGGVKSDGTTLSYTAEDSAEITARAAIEGGSGIYENVYVDSSIVNDTMAAAVATNLLKKFGLIPLSISFESFSTDWRPATKLKVNLPSFSISSDRYFLIERVTMQDEGGNVLRTLIEGASKDTSDFSTQPSDNYVDYFRRWLETHNQIIKQSEDYADHVGSGKNTTYYQTSQPSGGTYIEGDTWFDTDDDNRIYEWDGASWSAVLFGENAIADLAITNAKIADATIQNAKIANLDAGKITTGTLAAARVEIGSGTSFDTGYDPTLIEVGGRNYCRELGGDNYNIADRIYSADVADCTLVTISGKQWIEQTGETTLRIASIDMEASTEYTWSFLVYTDGADTSIQVRNYDGGAYGTTNYTIGTSPVKIAHTFTTNADTTYEILHISSLSGTDNYYFADFKLERGNKATDWSPAPEDLIHEGVTYQGVSITAADGFVSEATIGGESTKVQLDSTDGLAFYQDDGGGGWTKRGGLALINDDLVLTIDTIAAASDVTNYINFDPAYVWSGQTFSAMRFWTDDADATPADVGHLQIFGDADKSSAETQTYINATSMPASGALLDYTRILTIGAQIPFSGGDGEAAYMRFTSDADANDGFAEIISTNSDGSDYFDVLTEYNEFSISDETGELLSLTRSNGLTVDGNKVVDESLPIKRYDAAGDADGMFEGGVLHDALSNSVSSFYAGYKSESGTWWRLRAGYADDADTLDTYHASSFLLKSGGTMTGNLTSPNLLSPNASGTNWQLVMNNSNYVYFRESTNTSTIRFYPDDGDFYLAGDIDGSTTDTWITARRIGLGVAANSTYTVDASTGYIRAGKYYSGSQGGINFTFKAEAVVGGTYAFDVVGGIIVDASLIP